MDGAWDREPVRGLHVAVQRGDYALGLGAAVVLGVPVSDHGGPTRSFEESPRGGGFNSPVGASILSTAASVEGSETKSRAS